MGDVETIIFNPLEPGYIEDPFDHLAEIRDLDPVHESPFGGWMLFRYDDVSRLLRDPKMSCDESNLVVWDQQRVAMFEEAYDGNFEESTSLLFVDPPDHTRLRRLVSKAFTPTVIEALRPMVRRMVDEMLDEMEEAGTTDVVHDLAFPLPFDVISEMLGMPEADKDLIAGWSAALVKTLDPILDEAAVKEAAEADRNMSRHLAGVIEWKRQNPADDILAKMIEAEEDGDRLSTRELQDQVSLLFVAGHETTVNLIGTGIYELMRHREQWELLRNDLDLDANAVEELLRFVAPVQFSRRITVGEPVEYGGRMIPAGVGVSAGLASSNRDPEKWGPTADQLDITREGANQHLSFGSGIHLCLGMSLAKLEAQEAIGRFVRRFPDAHVDGDVEWNGRINLRGLEHLPVRVR
jgi:cytochrome P450